MYDPKDILTEDGYEDYLVHLMAIRKGLAYIMNHADDLHIGMEQGREDVVLDMYHKFEEILPILKKGDGEKDEQ